MAPKGMPVMMIDTVDSYVDFIDEETWQQLVASLLCAHRAEIISQRCVKRACVKQLVVLVRDVGHLPRSTTRREESARRHFATFP
jgi:hypothetical protein